MPAYKCILGFNFDKSPLLVAAPLAVPDWKDIGAADVRDQLARVLENKII